MAISSKASAVVLVAACLCGGPVAGQSGGASIYSCTGPTGTAVLQNAPCDGDARPIAPADPTPIVVPAAAAPTDQAGAAGANDSAGPAPARTAQDGTTAASGEPSPGMTQDQVRSILGEPSAIRQEEVMDGKVTTWTYGDSRVLQFDATGRLSNK